MNLGAFVAQVWLEVRPIRRWKAKRAAKKAAKHPEAAEAVNEAYFNEAQEGGNMNEQVSSVIRTVIKTAGGGLVGTGLVTSGELEILAGAVAIIVGLVWSWAVKRKVA